VLAQLAPWPLQQTMARGHSQRGSGDGDGASPAAAAPDSQQQRSGGQPAAPAEPTRTPSTAPLATIEAVAAHATFAAWPRRTPSATDISSNGGGPVPSSSTATAHRGSGSGSTRGAATGGHQHQGHGQRSHGPAPPPEAPAVTWASVSDDLSYALPVDSEHKATRLALCSLARPHMRAFHLSWIAFFLCFFSTFAAAALLPLIREELDLTQRDVGNAGIASVCGAIGSRVVMGWLVDAAGPRVSAAALLLLTAPAIFGMALIDNAAGFVALRAVIGLNLSMFVVNQYWVSSMFNTRIVGCANAMSAGGFLVAWDLHGVACFRMRPFSRGVGGVEHCPGGLHGA